MIPSLLLPPLPSFHFRLFLCMLIPRSIADYLKNETGFRKRIEDDANSFRPCGTLVYSYSRPSSLLRHAKESQGDYGSADNSEEYQDSIFEVYHVNIYCPPFPPLKLIIR